MSPHLPMAEKGSHMSAHSSASVYILYEASGHTEFWPVHSAFWEGSQREELAGNWLYVLCNMFQQSRLHNLENYCQD